MATDSLGTTARELREMLAGTALTQSQAKLYSQRLRRDMGREGLLTFVPEDVEDYLDQALLLLQCGFIERESDPLSRWRDSIKRAAELLEWLSQPALRPAEAPLHLLAAAAYQLADYPAMALGHLRYMPSDEASSRLLREFLRAHFPATLEAIRKFWRRQREAFGTSPPDQAELSTLAFQHVVRCIGAVVAFLRTGDEGTTNRAVAKLENLAAGFLHSRDSYSHVLATLTAQACRRFVETSIWSHLALLRAGASNAAGEALTQFGRSAFLNRRILAWPAQTEGIRRLATRESFVLCTPTGSGKTTVATLGLVQDLFEDSPESDQEDKPGLLALYMVPSRALAAEVEARLSQDLRGIAATPVIVTGLYGGVDWGPTDAWIQTPGASIVICTFEKADALLRYLGVLFLDRVRLVVVDEAHMVEQDLGRLLNLRDGTSRAFRLEQLGARLLRAREDHKFRIIALSAVAARAAPALARWLSDGENNSPTVSTHRSTRQMLGRVEVSGTGNYTIRYDLMDGRSLEFDEERPGTKPYVPRPFAALPGGVSPADGPEVSMRPPTLWAALQLAAERPDGTRPSVLISVTQNVEAFARTCAGLLEQWSDAGLPNYWSIDQSDDVWTRCLASAEDYFTVGSVEYRLLRRGVAVHHGKMPGLLARRLKNVIDRGYVRVIIATSTLSEGVNIPVNYVLIPSLHRGAARLSVQEFTNLIGRAGRPGVATEGSALVVLPERQQERRNGRLRSIPSRQWTAYQEIVREIERSTVATREGQPEDNASSPLSHLLRELERAWRVVAGETSNEAFLNWLEQAALGEPGASSTAPLDYLESLDAFLITAIEEIEELRGREIAPDELEEELTAIWRRTYAYASGKDEARLRETWLIRGRGTKSRYPDATQRRRIYRTSLPPRSATQLIEISATVRAQLLSGTGYARWTAEERFAFLREIIALLSQVPAFRLSTTLGRKKEFHDWPNVLLWWLDKTSLHHQPEPERVSAWYEFVAQNFIYRAAWGMGSIIGLLLELGDGTERVRAIEIGDWPRSGLPWIAFWIKELLTWGTLEPVAAFLLARGDAVSRPQAEADARLYYEEADDDQDTNDLLDPRKIGEWLGSRRPQSRQTVTTVTFVIEVTLARLAGDYLQARMGVMPLELDGALVWLDSAGHRVADSTKPDEWPDVPARFDFELLVNESRITGTAYLRHA
jgi:superfamily II DNA/RNA helicase